MTLSAQWVPKHPNAPEGTPEKIKVVTTYGPITNEVVEEVAHLRSFWSNLGFLLDQAEPPKAPEAD